MAQRFMLARHMSAGHNVPMVEVIATDEFTEWFEGLDEADVDPVAKVVDMLAEEGVTLRFPYSSNIKGSKAALRELRIQANGKPVRVFYAFDPERQAVLLIGGDKSGDKRFYDRMVPMAEKIWKQYLKEMGR
jgi:hypothetical protein